MASRQKTTFRISFEPEGKEVTVAAGTLLVDAADRAGLLIDTPCGGQGRCGRCLVQVLSGDITRGENPHLSQEQTERGWVLSCTARINGDLRVTMPPQKERERLAVEATTSSRAALPVECDFPLLPIVRRVPLKLQPPSLDDSTADAQRLAHALAQNDVDDVTVELPLLQRLSHELRSSEWQITTVMDVSNGARMIDLYPGSHNSALLGIAVDIGTTNVVAELVDLRSGRSIEQISARNRQILRGEDIISRIIFSEKGGLEELHRLVMETVNELVAQLGHRHRFQPRDVQDMVVAGNTTMVHLLLGIPPKSIRQEPYAPSATSFPRVKAGELGIDINPLAGVYCLPAVAAYVGGDITAGILSSCLFRSEKLTLFLDVGTNGEIVLGNQEWMTTCACSAGPSFEGAGVLHGMRAVPGAIEEVRINSNTLEPTLRVIGDKQPEGICGSGMISAGAELMLTGVIDRSGRIQVEEVQRRMGKSSRARIGEHGPEFVLAWEKESGTRQDIVITGVDIGNIIRTKGAVYAGIAVMLHSLGIEMADVEQVFIGGAFGQHINVEGAIQIGLLPDLPWDRFSFLGNTSLSGAYHALISRHARAQADDVVSMLTYFELIAEPSFMDEFSAALFLPHTNMNLFPSVRAAMEKG
ncbi:MAG: ASKHA domain-containing protein [Dehalococcoidia bacterium]|nr:ASKHA domain-containing protein [Dehalococcoidia bacterium]